MKNLTVIPEEARIQNILSHNNARSENGQRTVMELLFRFSQPGPLGNK